MGGTLEAVYFLNSTRWHLMTIQELPDSDAVFALLSFTGTTNALLDGEVIELRSAEEADAAIARQLAWVPPGQS